MHIITERAFSYPPRGERHNCRITNLILREGTDTIMDYAFRSSISSNPNTIKKVKFPSTLKRIGVECFYNTRLDTFSLNDNIEIIGDEAFSDIPYTPDTLILPKNLKTYNITSFNRKAGQTIYIPKSVTNVYYNNINSHLEPLVFHLESPIPIPFGYDSYKCLQYCTVYVPKGSLDLYKNEDYFPNTYNPWSYAQLLLEEPCPVEDVSLDKTSATLKIGETLSLHATVSPDNADDPSLKWSSDDETVATVDATGKVIALKSGRTNINVVSVDNPDAKDICTISVINPVQEIKLDAKNISLNVGDEKQLKISITPTDADNKEVSWASSNEEIATVGNDGTVTGKKAGTAIITVMSAENEDIKDECEITVLQPVTGIMLDRNEAMLNQIGATLQLTAIVLPEDASNKEVRWSSSEESVCSVSSNGTIVALGNGTSIITATTVDNGFVAVCAVTVDTNATGISDIENINENDIESYYTIDGRRIASPQKGLNIIKLKDGTAKKIIVK